MKRFRDIPSKLRKQVYLRSVMATIFLIVSVLILVWMKDFVFALPCIAMFVFLSVNVGLWLYDCLAEKYVLIEGECVGAEFSPVRKHLTAIYVATDKEVYKVTLRHKLGKVDEGDEIVVYISARMRLYKQDGKILVPGYYAMEVVKA